MEVCVCVCVCEGENWWIALFRFGLCGKFRVLFFEISTRQFQLLFAEHAGGWPTGTLHKILNYIYDFLRCFSISPPRFSYPLVLHGRGMLILETI